MQIPSIRIDAQVDPVRVGADGVLGIPEQPTVLGWWTGGAMPGAGRGTVVVDGHLDSRRYGTGPLVRLGQLQPGDRAVLSAGKQRREYAVSALRVYRKTTLPYAQIFAQDVPERLVLVTCGGSYSRGQGWDSNVVVYLEPVR